MKIEKKLYTDRNKTYIVRKFATAKYKNMHIILINVNNWKQIDEIKTP